MGKGTCRVEGLCTAQEPAGTPTPGWTRELRDSGMEDVSQGAQAPQSQRHREKKDLLGVQGAQKGIAHKTNREGVGSTACPHSPGSSDPGTSHESGVPAREHSPRHRHPAGPRHRCRLGYLHPGGVRVGTNLNKSSCTHLSRWEGASHGPDTLPQSADTRKGGARAVGSLLRHPSPRSRAARVHSESK